MYFHCEEFIRNPAQGILYQQTKDANLFHSQTVAFLVTATLDHPSKLVVVHFPSQAVRVTSAAELVAACEHAQPGAMIVVAPGDYPGGIFVSNVHGSAKAPITIRGEDPENPPRFVGGGSTLQFSGVSYLVLSDLIISHSRDNGINVDDAGTYTHPSHHVTLRNLKVSDLPEGIHNSIKLSGLDDFRVEHCELNRWGGSGIDLVGCHRGVITRCSFRNGGKSGVQAKGGSSDIRVQACRFEDFGERGVNIGGATDRKFFRPPLDQVTSGARFESKNIVVEGNEFLGGGAPIAFVGADGGTVRYNTFRHPGHFVIRILQETLGSDFVPCRNGQFSHNLVVFDSTNWGSGGVNVGEGTNAKTFRFVENVWFCADKPSQSKPNLPVPESGGIYGVDPELPSGPARHVGAGAWSRPSGR